LARQGRLALDAESLALLYLADRLDHEQRADGMKAWRAAGRHVVCTHYRLAADAWLSGLVQWEWLQKIDTRACVPDLTLYVDFPAQGPRQDSLAAGYRAAVERLRDQGREIHVVDGVATPERLQSTCRRYLARLLGLDSARIE
jgi:thymidylate kinase